jgi:hypothetical protein
VNFVVYVYANVDILNFLDAFNWHRGQVYFKVFQWMKLKLIIFLIEYKFSQMRVIKVPMYVHGELTLVQNSFYTSLDSRWFVLRKVWGFELMITGLLVVKNLSLLKSVENLDANFSELQCNFFSLLLLLWAFKSRVILFLSSSLFFVIEFFIVRVSLIHRC